MFKTLFLSLLLGGSLWAGSSFNIGDKIGNFSLLNQFDEKQTVDTSVQTIMVSFEKDTGADINEFLSHQKSDFLQKREAVFIANISGMPMVITKMFALPKMRNYKHPILLIYDENDTRFKAQEGKSTLYTLKNGAIQSIEFITKDDLKTIFKND
ncbi:MAG: hypothetical protein WC149_11855 [Arcobacteraceae bacterium]